MKINTSGVVDLPEGSLLNGVVKALPVRFVRSVKLGCIVDSVKFGCMVNSVKLGFKVDPVKLGCKVDLVKLGFNVLLKEVVLLISIVTFLSIVVLVSIFEVDVQILLHIRFSSSLPSKQSIIPSHFFSIGIHFGCNFKLVILYILHWN